MLLLSGLFASGTEPKYVQYSNWFGLYEERLDSSLFRYQSVWAGVGGHGYTSLHDTAEHI